MSFSTENLKKGALYLKTVISNDYIGFIGKRFMIGNFKVDLD